MNFNAKERFNAKKELARQWTEFTDSDSFGEGVQAALVVMQAQVRQSSNPQDAALASLKMEGAMQFIGVMTALTASAPPPKNPLTTANLDHNA